MPTQIKGYLLTGFPNPQKTYVLSLVEDACKVIIMRHNHVLLTRYVHFIRQASSSGRKNLWVVIKCLGFAVELPGTEAMSKLAYPANSPELSSNPLKVYAYTNIYMHT